MSYAPPRPAAIRAACTCPQVHLRLMRLHSQRTVTSSAQVNTSGQGPAWQGVRQGWGQFGSCLWQSLSQHRGSAVWPVAAEDVSEAGASATFLARGAASKQASNSWQGREMAVFPQRHNRRVTTPQGGQTLGWQGSGHLCVQARALVQGRVQDWHAVGGSDDVTREEVEPWLSASRGVLMM